MPSEKSISTFVKDISQNDCEVSFRKFFNHFHPRLYELALYYTKNHLSAEEVVSDVFLKIWKQRARLNTIQNISAYLLVTTKNQSLNYLRHTKHTPNFVYDLDYQSALEAYTPESILLKQELLEAINLSIQKLPERCRLAYKMVKEERLKYKEVAQLMNISEKTVEMHVGNALKKIWLAVENFQQEPQSTNSNIRSTLLSILILLFLTS